MKKRTMFLILAGVGIAAAAAAASGGSWQPIRIVDELPKAPWNGVYPKRSLSQVSTIVVHHAAVPSTAPGATPQGYATFHTTSSYYNLPGIAYHIVIQPDGNAYLCNDLDTISAHVGTLNPNAIGVVLSGNFDNEPMTDIQEQTLIRTLKWIQKQVGKPLKIHGHYRYSQKTCPGANVRTKLSSIVSKAGGLE